MAETARYSTIFCGFSSLMDIDKLIPYGPNGDNKDGFSSLMDIDKLIHIMDDDILDKSFSSLMDIDKLIRAGVRQCAGVVLVL